MSEHGLILVAEDEEADVLLLQRAFREAQVPNPLRFVHDGQEAIEFLTALRGSNQDRFPVLVMLDLKMPRRTGLETLQWIRQQPVLGCLPVMIFSSSSRREDVERAYTLGANCFIVKPPSTAQRIKLVQFIKDWVNFNEPPMVSSEGFHAAQSEHLSGAFKPPPL